MRNTILTEKVCVKCDVLKPASDFHQHKLCKGGINTVCKDCRKPLSRKGYEGQTAQYKLWYRAKRRALDKNLEFSIELSDIIVPKLCPVFLVEMETNTEYAASLDRIDSTKGYVKGNIQVISTKANVLKNNASIKDLKTFAKWVLSL